MSEQFIVRKTCAVGKHVQMLKVHANFMHLLKNMVCTIRVLFRKMAPSLPLQELQKQPQIPMYVAPMYPSSSYCLISYLSIFIGKVYLTN